MTARTLQGLALVSLGRVPEGTRLLDEGTAAATAGELYDPIAIGSCCCNMIIACERARDFDRAGQWCEQLSAFCERTGQRPLLALCRAHHGTVLTMRGEWEDAERELAWATGELSMLRPPLAGYARARFAQLRRRQGRYAEARRAARARPASTCSCRSSRPRSRSTRTTPRQRWATPSGTSAASAGEQPIESAAALELLVPIRIRLGEPEPAREAHAAAGGDRRRRRDRSDPRRGARRERRDRARRPRPRRRHAARSKTQSSCTGAASRRSMRRERGWRWPRCSPRTIAPAQRSSRRTRRRRRWSSWAPRGLPRRRPGWWRRLGGRTTAAKRAGLTGRELEVLDRSSPTGCRTRRSPSASSSASTPSTATSPTSTPSSACPPAPRRSRSPPNTSCSPSAGHLRDRVERWPDRAMPAAGTRPHTARHDHDQPHDRAALPPSRGSSGAPAPATSPSRSRR